MSIRNSIPDPVSVGHPPRVSIVVPTHDRPETLSRLLESFRLLIYPRSRLELIVVGGSHDRGRRLVDAFAESVDFRAAYHTVPNDFLRSASFKRNEGARWAQGTILAFTDDDCVVDADWITAAVSLFNAPQVGGVEGAVRIPRPDRPTLTYRRSLRLSLPQGYQTCNMLYRKSVFEECGGFDLFFPYYLEDTDLAYTVLERGHTIPYAADAIVSHPVQAGRPLKLLMMARTVERMPYLFLKHGMSPKLRASVRPFNRSHYVYLLLYAVVLLVTLVAPVVWAVVAALGVCLLVLAHLARDFWGLHFTASELALTALCQPIVPVLRLFYWIKGSALVWFAPPRPDQQPAVNCER